MTKRTNYSPEEEKVLLNIFFDLIEEDGITPDFSKEDWLDLHKRAWQGDLTSSEMYIALMQEKVLPQLDQDILKTARERIRRED